MIDPWILSIKHLEIKYIENIVKELVASLSIFWIIQSKKLLISSHVDLKKKRKIIFTYIETFFLAKDLI